MTDIAAAGLVVTLRASNTFPVGIILTQFSDDTDPFDLPSMQIGDVAMGLNGNQLTWSKAIPIKITLSVAPSSPDDILLSILFNANRVGYGKVSAKDIVTINAVYPDKRFITLTNGIITDGMPGNAVSSAGRLKTKVYGFSFQNSTGI